MSTSTQRSLPTYPTIPHIEWSSSCAHPLERKTKKARGESNTSESGPNDVLSSPFRPPESRDASAEYLDQRLPRQLSRFLEPSRVLALTTYLFCWASPVDLAEGPG